MHKDWDSICAVRDPVLRLLVTVAKDRRTLRGLEKAFPELFSEEQQRVARVPLSVIKALYKAQPEDVGAEWPLRQLGIPCIYLGTDFGPKPQTPYSQMPEVPATLAEVVHFDLEDALNAEEEIITVEYLGQEHILVHLTYPDHACITPKSCIDLTA